LKTSILLDAPEMTLAFTAKNNGKQDYKTTPIKTNRNSLLSGH
jgi:hypothetical protein